MLFTVILEFDGVTSVSQVDHRNVRGAFEEWTENLRYPEKLGLTTQQGRALAEAFDVDRGREPSELRDVRNVWCTTALSGNKLALVNIVATDSRENTDPSADTGSRAI